MKCTYRRRGVTGLVASALILGSMALARGADFELPALYSPASGEHHPGKMLWADLVTPDLAAAEKFYGGLFGWTFQPVRAGSLNFAVAMLNGQPVGGIVEKKIPAGQQRQPAWLTFWPRMMSTPPSALPFLTAQKSSRISRAIQCAADNAC